MRVDVLFTGRSDGCKGFSSTEKMKTGESGDSMRRGGGEQVESLILWMRRIRCPC